MAGNARVAIPIKSLSFPKVLGERLLEMAEEREMSVKDLIIELVHIGMMDLDKNPPQIEIGRRRDAEFTLPDL